MGSIQEVKEALSAQARTATLDELRSRGRQQVRIIRAEQVAAMVAEAVERALANSGMVPQEDLERLVAESRQQFAEVNRERQREHDQRQQLTAALEEAQQVVEAAETEAIESREQVRALEVRIGELEGVRLRAAELEPEVVLLRARVSEMEREIEGHRAHVRENLPVLQQSQDSLVAANRSAREAEDRAGRLAMELEATRQIVETKDRQQRDSTRKLSEAQTALASAEGRISELEHELAALRESAERIDVADAATAAQVDVMAQVLEELATLKAKVNAVPPVPAAAMTFHTAPPPVQQAVPQPQQASPVVDQLTVALSKLTQSMTDKMEQFGRKMGISGAVESGPVNLEGLFKDLDKQKVESNLDSMEVKSKQAGGIAANLAKLKKLKGN